MDGNVPGSVSSARARGRANGLRLPQNFVEGPETQPVANILCSLRGEKISA